MTLALVGGGGCSNESLVARDGGNKPAGPDGSVPGVDAIDAAACGCQVEGGTLTISMECYCKQYDCTRSPFTLYCSDVSMGVGCGIVEVSLDTVGGVDRWAYNDERTLIGAQLTTDDGVFTCPTDPNLQGDVLRAGVFPLEEGGFWFDGCASVSSCPCIDGKASSCPTVDAGSSTAPDAATP